MAQKCRECWTAASTNSDGCSRSNSSAQGPDERNAPWSLHHVLRESVLLCRTPNQSNPRIPYQRHSGRSEKSGMNTVKQLVSGVILVLVMFFLVSASLLLSELSYKAHDFILSLTLLTGSGVLTG